MDLVRDHSDPIHELAQFPGLPKYFSKKIKDLNIKGSKYKYFFQLICNIILICLSLSKKECYSCPPYPVWHENCCPRACQSSPRARGPRAGLTRPRAAIIMPDRIWGAGVSQSYGWYLNLAKTRKAATCTHWEICYIAGCKLS